MPPSRSDARAIRLSMLGAGLAVGQLVAGESLREGLFLSTFSIGDLPKAMLGSALLSIPLALLAGRWMTRWGPGTLAPLVFLLSAAGSFAEWALLPTMPRVAALLVYFHVSLGGALSMSAFWSVVNERFDPHTLKHLVGRITASATLGGLSGGAAMERIAHWLDARSTLLLVAVGSVVAALAVHALARTLVRSAPSLADSEPHRPRVHGGYLWTLALLVASSAAASTFADFGLKQAAVVRYARAEELVRFFALFYTGTSLLGFLLQVFVSRPLFDAVGVGGMLAVAPGLGVGFGIVSCLFPSFAGFAVLRGSDLTLGPSLFRSAFEPLFTPLPAATKRGAKALIDVVFDKGGDAVASSSILLLTLGTSGVAARTPALLALGAFALALGLSFRARRGYVVQLERSLRTGIVRLEDLESPAVRLALSVTSAGLDRKSLLESIAQHQGRVAPERASDEGLPEDVGILLGSDEEAIQQLLSRSSLDRRLAAFVAPHLGNENLAAPALSALRSMGPEVLGLLGDVMLGTHHSLAVRRRVPHVLRAFRGADVALALKRALADDALEVRYRAALALSEVTRGDPVLRPDPKELFALAMDELSRGPWTEAARDHVFALLGLATTQSGIELIRQGLRSDDAKLRGTALEYLESLLPEGVRIPLVRGIAAHGS